MILYDGGGQVPLQQQLSLAAELDTLRGHRRQPHRPRTLRHEHPHDHRLTIKVTVDYLEPLPVHRSDTRVRRGRDIALLAPGHALQARPFTLVPMLLHLPVDLVKVVCLPVHDTSIPCVSAEHLGAFANDPFDLHVRLQPRNAHRLVDFCDARGDRTFPLLGISVARLGLAKPAPQRGVRRLILDALVLAYRSCWARTVRRLKLLPFMTSAVTTRRGSELGRCGIQGRLTGQTTSAAAPVGGLVMPARQVRGDGQGCHGPSTQGGRAFGKASSSMEAAPRRTSSSSVRYTPNSAASTSMLADTSCAVGGASPTACAASRNASTAELSQSARMRCRPTPPNSGTSRERTGARKRRCSVNIVSSQNDSRASR